MEKVPIFQFASQSLKDLLLISLETKIYPPGGMIVKGGEYGDELYLFSRGKAIIVTDEDNESHGELSDGDYFGNISLLLGERRTASVKAISYCEFLLLTKAKFDQIKKECPEFKRSVEKSII